MVGSRGSADPRSPARLSSASAPNASPPRSAGVRIAALFAASLAIALAVAITFKAGPQLVGDPPSIDVPASAMSATKGRGRVDGDVLVLEALDANGVGLIVAPTPAFAADEYTRLTWHLAGEAPGGLEFALVWRSRGERGRMRTAPIEWTRGPVTIDLARQRDWAGTIEGVALAVRGPLSAPLAIAGLSARSNAWDVTLGDALRQWFAWPRADGRAAVVQFEDESRHVVPMLPVVALAVALGAAYLVFRARRRREPVAPAAVAALFLAGWLLLDLRWQGILWGHHQAALAQFAGKTIDEKRESDLDAPIFDLARRVRDAPHPEDGRILVLSDNEHLRTRVGWFLYPRNVFYDSRPPRQAAPPAPDQLRPGDQVLLLLYGPIRWDSDRRRLVWTDGRTRAAREILSDGPAFALVEVDGG